MSSPEARQTTSEEWLKAFCFIKAALQFYDSEPQRQMALQPFFGDSSRLVETKVPSAQSHFMSDGSNKVMVSQPQRIPTKVPAYTCLVELKNEFGEGGSDPKAQVQSSYVNACSSDEVWFPNSSSLIHSLSLTQYAAI
jgi:hypothetical protein